MAKKASDLGIEVDVLSQNQVADMQGVEMDVRGGVLFPGDAQLNPVDFMTKLQTYLRTQGVKFMYETDIEEIRIAKNKVTELLTNKGEVFDVDELIMATGAWSGEMAIKLNLKLPMQGGKGYSFNVDNPEQSIKVQSILCEAKVAVTPFKESIRFAGTMEINGLSLGQNKRRIQAIEKSIPNYLPSFNMEQIDLSHTWAGLRPCSPDGLPYIGKAKQDNVWIASGHAMMGMSMGPISGKLMSQLIDQEKPLLAVDQLSPLRYA
jgi:D-amino-acid dehydrogenase